MLSPAWPWSRIFLNISTEVATVFWVGLKPMISTSPPGLIDAPLDPARDDRAAAGDGEDVLDGHEEGLVRIADGLGDVGVAGIQELEDALAVGAVGLPVAAFERLQGGALDDGYLVSGELIGGEELSQLQLDELDELRVVHHVHLVQVDHDGGDAHLAGKQYMLPCLGHGAVVRAHDQDRPVHLGGAGDHVLNIVSVARAVDMGVVALRPSRTRRGPSLS